MGEQEKRGSYSDFSASDHVPESQTRSRLKLARRIAGRSVMQATNEAADTGAKMVLKTGMFGSFRGFTHTPEEGQRLSRTSFTDAPLLRRVTKK